MIEKNKSIDFVFVGPMKTGTSWTHEYLALHPSVSVPTQVKETYYFSKNYTQGEAWYHDQFSSSDKPSVTGEVSPTYFAEPDVAKRVYQQNRNTKIIVTVREPLARFISHYNHNVRAGFVKADSNLASVYRDNDNMRRQASYFENIQMWIELFGSENTTVLLYEELDSNPQSFVDKICNHLGIETFEIPESLNEKIGTGRTPFSVPLVKFLYKVIGYLRTHNFHFLINAAKKLGLSRLLYVKKEAPTYVGKAELIPLLMEDANRLEQLSVDIMPWREIWQKRENAES